MKAVLFQIDHQRLKEQGRRRAILHNPNNPRDLTPREVDCLLLILTGLKSSDVAERLGITVRSLGTYRERIYSKFEVHGPIELAQRALRDGYITLQDFAGMTNGQDPFRHQA